MSAKKKTAKKTVRKRAAKKTTRKVAKKAIKQAKQVEETPAPPVNQEVPGDDDDFNPYAPKEEEEQPNVVTGRDEEGNLQFKTLEESDAEEFGTEPDEDTQEPVVEEVVETTDQQPQEPDNTVEVLPADKPAPKEDDVIQELLRASYKSLSNNNKAIQWFIRKATGRQLGDGNRKILLNRIESNLKLMRAIKRQIA